MRLQVFKLFFGGDPFGRNLRYLACSKGKLDPQVAGELPLGGECRWRSSVWVTGASAARLALTIGA